MTTPEMTGILRSLARHTGHEMPVIPLAECAHALGMEGLAISLRADDGSVELVQYSNVRAALADDVQYMQGWGPVPDVARRGTPVLLPDLAAGPDSPWPGLLPDLQRLGIRAVFAFPMRMGAAQLGVLTGYRADPGALTSEEWADALLLAQVIACLVRAFAVGVEDPDAWLERQSPLRRAKVHQATGMVAVQRGMSAADALVCIKARAYGQDEPLLATATGIVDGRLRLDDGPPQQA